MNIHGGKSWSFAVIENEQLIGFGHLDKFESERKRHVVDLGIVIHPEFQGKGYGKALMEHMRKWAVTHDVRKIRLRAFEDNKIAIKLYESQGFVIEGCFIDEEKWGNEHRSVLSMAWFT